jgi:hypothetical protein
MAISDLLWACPLCRSLHALRKDGREALCAACGARLSREDGARIRVVGPDGSRVAAGVTEWEAGLPAIDDIPEDGVLGPEPVTVRYGLPARPVRASGRLIGWAERFGPRLLATARLDAESIAIHLADGRIRSWALEDLTAIQPSSSALQLNTRTELVSLRFLEGCVRRWEAVLCRLIRDRARSLGRREIAEFQPRIRYE